MRRELVGFRGVQPAVAAVVVGVLVACSAACGTGNKGAVSPTGAGITTQTQTRTTTPSPASSQQTTSATTNHLHFKLIGTADEPYVARMKAIGKTFEKAVRALYPLATGTTGSPVRSGAEQKLEGVRQTITDVEENLQDVTPPVRIKPLHMRLSKAVSEVGTELDGMISALEQNDLGTYISLSRLRGLNAVNATTKLMKKDGYDIVVAG